MNISSQHFVNRTLHAQERYFRHIISKNKAYITEALLNDELCKAGFTELHEYLETLEENINEITQEFIIQEVESL